MASAELRASNEASLTAAVLVAYGGSVSDKRKADCGSLLPGNQRTRKSDVSAVCARVGRRTRCQHSHLSSGLTAASRDWMAAMRAESSVDEQPAIAKKPGASGKRPRSWKKKNQKI